MVYILLADGFEEIEALTPVDILRRADIDIKTVGVTNKIQTGAHNIPVECDILIDEISDDIDMLILPGGAGYEILDASNAVHGLINHCVEKEIYISSICAAPSILGKKGLLSGKKATCFPGFEKYLFGADVTKNKTEKDGIFLTAKGAGAAAEFAFEIVKILKDEETANKLKEMMCY